MVDESGARRSHFTHNIERGADNQRGDSTILDDVSDETDGLMAKWSVGNEQGQVNRRPLKFPCYGWCQIIFDFFVTTKSAHEGNVDGGNACDGTLLGKPGQSRSRKNDFRVLARDPPDSGTMIDDNLAGSGVRRHQSIT
jgi:hypothetical protein